MLLVDRKFSFNKSSNGGRPSSLKPLARSRKTTAPHEPRNALLFPPAYEGAQKRPVVKAIQRANTRFKEEPRARSNTTGSYPDLSSVSSETTSPGDDVAGGSFAREP